MQNREAPAFQEYAAAMMAKIAYRTMTLAERGLLYSMRLECWVNDRLPADQDKLAKVLGYCPGEVKNALPAVMEFFTEDDEFITSPDLDSYKLHLLDSRNRQVLGGRKGGIKSAKKRAGKQP